MMMQAVLGLGMMLIMTPIVLNQIKKYNETAKREEAIAQLQLLRKAVTSFVSFDRENDAITVDKCKQWSGNEMTKALAQYGGDAVFGTTVKTENSLGMSYFFVTYKDGATGSVEALAGASFPPDVPNNKCYSEDDITLNGIGQFLFDKGGVVGSDFTTDFRSNYDVKPSPRLEKRQDGSECTPMCSAVMFVSDAFFISDYLHTDANSMDPNHLMNTMLMPLNMKGHSITDIGNIGGHELLIGQGGGKLEAVLLSGSALSLASSKISGMSLFSVNGDGNDPSTVMKNSADGFQIYPEKFEMHDANVDNLTVRQVCMSLECDASNGLGVGDMFMDGTSGGTLSADDMVVSGSLAFVKSTGLSPQWRLHAERIVADRWVSDRGMNELGDIKFTNADGVSNSIYSGTWNESDGAYVMTDGMYANINPSGVSEMKDIVWGSGSGARSLSCEVCKIKRRIDCALDRISWKVGGGEWQDDGAGHWVATGAYPGCESRSISISSNVYNQCAAACAGYGGIPNENKVNQP
jgi:hypothetical protein